MLAAPLYIAFAGISYVSDAVYSVHFEAKHVYTIVIAVEVSITVVQIRWSKVDLNRLRIRLHSSAFLPAQKSPVPPALPGLRSP